MALYLRFSRVFAVYLGLGHMSHSNWFVSWQMTKDKRCTLCCSGVGVGTRLPHHLAQQLVPQRHQQQHTVTGWKLSYCNQHNNLLVTMSFQLFLHGHHQHGDPTTRCRFQAAAAECICARLWQCDMVHKNPLGKAAAAAAGRQAVTAEAKAIFQRNNL